MRILLFKNNQKYVKMAYKWHTFGIPRGKKNRKKWIEKVCQNGILLAYTFDITEGKSRKMNRRVCQNGILFGILLTYPKGKRQENEWKVCQNGILFGILFDIPGGKTEKWIAEYVKMTYSARKGRIEWDITVPVKQVCGCLKRKETISKRNQNRNIFR